MRRIRILLVEDDTVISDLMCKLLAVFGHDVCGTAVTELEAVDAAGRHRPDLMIVDVYLRDGTGVSAMSTIHQRNAMPHIFMTGGGRHIVPKDAVLLQKPFGSVGLNEALQRVAWQIPPQAAGSAQLQP